MLGGRFDESGVAVGECDGDVDPVAGLAEQPSDYCPGGPEEDPTCDDAACPHLLAHVSAAFHGRVCALDAVLLAVRLDRGAGEGPAGELLDGLSVCLLSCGVCGAVDTALCGCECLLVLHRREHQGVGCCLLLLGVDDLVGASRPGRVVVGGDQFDCPVAHALGLVVLHVGDPAERDGHVLGDTADAAHSPVREADGPVGYVCRGPVKLECIVLHGGDTP